MEQNVLKATLEEPFLLVKKLGVMTKPLEVFYKFRLVLRPLFRVPFAVLVFSLVLLFVLAPVVTMFALSSVIKGITGTHFFLALLDLESLFHLLGALNAIKIDHTKLAAVPDYPAD